MTGRWAEVSVRFCVAQLGFLGKKGHPGCFADKAEADLAQTGCSRSEAGTDSGHDEEDGTEAQLDSFEQTCLD